MLATHELVDLINGLAVKEGQQPSIESFSTIPYYQWTGEELKIEGL